jgi:hypothetical protein
MDRAPVVVSNMYLPRLVQMNTATNRQATATRHGTTAAEPPRLSTVVSAGHAGVK